MEQFKGLIEFMEKFNTDQKCRDHLRQTLYPVNPTCKCGKRMYYSEEARNTGYFRGFKCQNCYYAFALNNNTVFSNSNLPLRKWFIAIYLFTVHSTGISGRRLGELIGVSSKTGWFMLQRIRVSLENTNLNKKLCGTVEADETYIGADRKKGNKRGRGSRNKIVFGAVERNGRAYGKVVPNCSGNSLQPIVYKKVRKRATLYTDGWNGYKGLTGFKHYRIKHKDSMAETRTIESFWNNVKSTIRTYRSVSLKHLQKYINEVVFRYNFRKHKIYEVFDLFLNKCFTHTSWRNLIDIPYVLD